MKFHNDTPNSTIFLYIGMDADGLMYILWTNGWTDGHTMDKWMDGRTYYGRMDGQTDRHTDGQHKT